MDCRSQISIVVPCFNYGHFLPKTLESVLKQSYSNWECIIIDDGSTDNTRNVARKYQELDERFKYAFQENKGLSAARNKGIELAVGDFFQFLDADDLIESNKLEIQLSFLIENPEVDIVYGDMLRFLSDQPDVRFKTRPQNDYDWMPKTSGKGADLIHQLIIQNIMVVSAPLIRSGVIQKTGVFNTSLRSGEDWEYWLRCALKGCSFSYFEGNETKTLIRSHPNSMMNNWAVMNENRIRLRKQIHSALNKSQKKSNRLQLFDDYGKFGLENIQKGNLLKGFWLIFKIRSYKVFYYFYHGFYWAFKKKS